MHDLRQIPEKYAWLFDEPGPLVIVEARKHIGVSEGGGDLNNPVIIQWAKKIGGWVARYYTKDSIAWCGLYVGYVMWKTKKPLNPKMLSARSWEKWGRLRREPPMLGDVLVFWRGSPESWKGHVGFYVGEDDMAYHVLGGNQGNKVSIVRISKNRLICARKFFKIGQPHNVRRIYLDEGGELSQNEA